ncbi:hypothetical protein A2Y68_01230 [Candidatus Woesebacteria bacterium RBG_13_46_13]|uniref:Uncharacterized protein n=1 Tax=Candidatus Woesebacteria bacterium RBG_13_46_13 TaxID=1802479 RepID=A0A1F7X5T8_9BACT|nr:MAG: hypothetical protein A2Y68_01230 [Candidatus Woesebacteria bacterium RBG_13_46_13]
MTGEKKSHGWGILETVLVIVLIAVIIIVVVAIWGQRDLQSLMAGISRQLAEPTATAAPAQAVIPLPTLQPTVVPLMPVHSGGQSDPEAVVASAGLERIKEPWSTPVRCEESFNSRSAWLVCEPGVILDATAAFTIPGTEEPWHINVPEGGFTYFSLGEGVITIDGVALSLPGEEGLNYLVLIRGRIDDTIMDSDLNGTAVVTDFVAGHAIWGIMPPGAYVSHDWFRDQLVVSSTTGGTNCGATGCSRVRIVLFDVDSHFYQMYETHTGDIDNWTLLAEN